MKVAIASGKGGTGKTTLTTNLAKYMAGTEPVVLADPDVEEPNSGLFIKGELYHQEPKYKMIPGEAPLRGVSHPNALNKPEMAVNPL